MENQIRPIAIAYLSVAHGWVTLLDPLPPGNHTIVIEDPINGTTTTTIVVTPGG